MTTFDLPGDLPSDLPGGLPGDVPGDALGRGGPAAARAFLPPPPATAPARFRWALHDGVTVVRRNLAQLKAQPGELVGALVFPAIMVVLFGYVFGSAIAVPGGGNYREYLMPGLFAMTTITGVLPTLLGMATDAGKGIMDRFRSMPIARSAVPFGQTGADILTGALAMTIMVGCGFVVGWRPHRGIAATLAAFGLLVLMRYAVSWLGAYLGLLIGDPQTADQYVPLVFPVTMVSNTFVPTAHMPVWLRAIADWNPVSALVAACRELFGNPGAPSGHPPWPIAHPVVATLGWSILLLAVCVPLAVRGTSPCPAEPPPAFPGAASMTRWGGSGTLESVEAKPSTLYGRDLTQPA